MGLLALFSVITLLVGAEGNHIDPKKSLPVRTGP